jgi:hypothetical protein
MPTRRSFRSRQALVKKGAANTDHRQGQDQAGPAHQLLDVRRHVAVGEVHRYGVHHHLHHAEAGDEQAPQRGLAFLLGQFLGAADVVGMGAVADRGDRFEDGRKLVTARPSAPARGAWCS